MNIDQVQKKIDSIVKVIFKERDQRTPMIGMFVNLNDSTDLSRKGMMRFVDQTRIEFYDPKHPSVGLTKIYVVSDISQIILMDGKR